MDAKHRSRCAAQVTVVEHKVLHVTACLASALLLLRHACDHLRLVRFAIALCLVPSTTSTNSFRPADCWYACLCTRVRASASLGVWARRTTVAAPNCYFARLDRPTLGGAVGVLSRGLFATGRTQARRLLGRSRLEHSAFCLGTLLPQYELLFADVHKKTLATPMTRVGQEGGMALRAIALTQTHSCPQDALSRTGQGNAPGAPHRLTTGQLGALGCKACV